MSSTWRPRSFAEAVPIVGFTVFAVLIAGIGLFNQIGFQYFDSSDFAGRPMSMGVAAIAAAASVLMIAMRAVNGWQVGLAAAVAGMAAAPLISALGHSQSVSVRGLVIPVLLGSAVLCAGASPPRLIRTFAFWLLAAIIWLSLATAVENLIFGGGSAFRTHYGFRHTEYLHVPVLSGITNHQNTIGFICAIALPVQWALVRRTAGRSGELRWPNRIALLIVGPGAASAALLWSQSRTALIAGIIGFALVSLPLQRLAGKWWAAAWAGGLAVLLLAPLAIGAAGITTFTGRTEMWGYAFDDFRANPLFGYGDGFMADKAYFADRGHFPDLFSAHSQLMQAAGETGLPGVLCFAAMATIVAAIAWRARGRDAALAAGLTAAWALTASQESIVPFAFAALREIYLPTVIALGLVAASATLMRSAETQSPAATEPDEPDEPDGSVSVRA